MYIFKNFSMPLKKHTISNPHWPHQLLRLLGRFDLGGASPSSWSSSSSAASPLGLGLRPEDFEAALALAFAFEAGAGTEGFTALRRVLGEWQIIYVMYNENMCIFKSMSVCTKLKGLGPDLRSFVSSIKARDDLVEGLNKPLFMTLDFLGPNR